MIAAVSKFSFHLHNFFTEIGFAAGEGEQAKN